MTESEKQQVDTMYAGFHRSPMREDRCPDCARPILYAHDEEGTLLVLDATLPAYVHIKDGKTRSPVVRKFTAYVEHAALCPAVRRNVA
jgi:hypothetical protein